MLSRYSNIMRIKDISGKTSKESQKQDSRIIQK